MYIVKKKKRDDDDDVSLETIHYIMVIETRDKPLNRGRHHVIIH